MSPVLIDVAKNPQDHYAITTPGDHVFFLFNTSGNFIFDVKASHANVHILGVMFGNQGSRITLNTTQKHAAPESTSNLFVKGAFFEDSQFTYHGLIDITKDGQQTDAQQTNRNLVLSKKAMVKSEPYLEIQADDVKCKHASTTGKMNEEELYYMMTRGIMREEAQKMLVNGFLEEVFEKAAQLGFEKEVQPYKKQIHEHIYA